MSTGTVARKGCGTCRERKVLCDRRTPTCSQCSRANRVCKGYGLRLSWPRPNDERRAMVVKHQLPTLPIMDGNTVDARLIRAYSSDVALHHHLSAPSTAPPVLYIPMPFGAPVPGAVTSHEHDLLRHFERHASHSLTIFGDDPSQAATLLIRMSLAGNTASATAVLYALLALSSLHRDGLQEQAINFKISALNKLAQASRTKFDIPEVLQHIAAGMLLSSFEVHQASAASSQWLWYVNGVKKVLDAVCPRAQHVVRSEEKSILLKWAHYHDALSRFTLRHWTGAAAALPPNWAEEQGSRNLPGTLIEAAGHFDRATGIAALGILETLKEVCDAVAVMPRLAGMTAAERDEYRGHLQALDCRLRTVDASEHSHPAELRDMVKLYQLAVLVYLHRATGDVLGFTGMTEKYLDEAFAMFARLEACERQFPVFILGSEARTEEERAIVLDLISRTVKTSSSRSLEYVRVLVNAVWTQNDLASGKLEYREKMTGVISACSVVPSLV